MSVPDKTPTVGDIITLVETLYPPSRAESWDRIGLIVGDRTRKARKILLAVDPVPQVIDEATTGGYDLLITHHPLYLRGTSFVSEDDAKGRMVAQLVRADCALYNAHTNADVSVGGVADALADLLGLTDVSPLLRGDELGVGAGRLGKVTPQRLGKFAETVASALPAGPQGVLVGGNFDLEISVVAVSGGSGDSFLEAARSAGADVFVTADLRHHPASEHLMDGAPALICGSHWATEWPWLPRLAEQIVEACSLPTAMLRVDVSGLVTEPWNSHLPTKGKT